jgi:hypothetical protein
MLSSIKWIYFELHFYCLENSPSENHDNDLFVLVVLTGTFYFVLAEMALACFFPPSLQSTNLCYQY